MTSITKLHVLSGALDESPPCYILQIDDVRILLDCGWNESSGLDFFTEIEKYVKYIDIVLLSHPDPEHLGALPYLVGKCGLNCPIYSTIPVYKMGQMFMYDLFQSRNNNEDFTIFNLDDVDAAFDKIIQMKYNQTMLLKGKCNGITLVPLLGGHMIGGTVWKIMKAGEEDIVYAMDFNHKKERHLNGCNFESLKRPSLLITNAYNCCFKQERRRVRDEKLMTNILQTLSNNGSVLIAIDTAGRVLEIAHMLDQLWGNKNSGLQNHSLCFLNNVSYNVMEFAKSQIEWMSEKLMKSFESGRYNPFHFKFIKTCHNLADIFKISTSKVVLASMPDLQCGFARNLCLEWISDPVNSIIITTKSNKGTLARELIDLNNNQKKIHVTIKRRERLTGEELVDFHKNNLQESVDSDSSNSADDVEIIGNISKSHDFVVKKEKAHGKRRKSLMSKSFPVFPADDTKKKLDEYGEIISISDYVKEIIEQNKSEEKMEEDHIDVVEFPTKCVSIEKDIEVNASIQFIPFEGKSDGESIQNFIALTRPQTVILVKGPPDETEILANYVRQWVRAEVFTPTRGEIVDTTSEINIYQIRLTDSLVSSLDMQKGDDPNLEVAWVDAIAKIIKRSYEPMEVDDDNSTFEKVVNNNYVNNNRNSNLLALAPVQDTIDIIPHSTLFINEIKFSDLKRTLNTNGIDCEFSGGILLCANRSIIVRRDDKNLIRFEGFLSEDYYKIRSLIYGHFAIL